MKKILKSKNFDKPKFEFLYVLRQFYFKNKNKNCSGGLSTFF